MKPIILILFIFFQLISCSTIDNESDEQENEFPEKIFEGNVLLSTQTEVMVFGAENYTHISGFLRIIGTDNGEHIIDLSPLGSLRVVNADIKINNNLKLTNLNGLNYINANANLGTNSVSLSIMNNPVLQNLNGLNGFRYEQDANFFLHIESNNSLQNLDGLENVITLMDVRLINNALLENIQGLRNVQSIGNFIIKDNARLTGFPVFDRLISFNIHSVDIRNNMGLISLEGLNIFEIAHKVNIEQNSLIQNLSGLSGLKKVKTILSIQENNSLTNLEGLENLKNLKDSLNIVDNHQLIDFCSLVNLITFNDPTNNTTYSISGNAYNPTEIQIVSGECSQ